MDRELELIQAMLDLIEEYSVDLDDRSVARAVDYLWDRVHSTPDPDPNVDEGPDVDVPSLFSRFSIDRQALAQEIQMAQHAIRRRMAEESQCSCENCRRLRGEVFDA